MEEKQIKGISPMYERGWAGLYKCLFWGSWSPHPAGFPIILLGGWKDDVLDDDTHHIQRIITDFSPPLDVRRILLPSKFPFEATSPLELRGYIATNGDFQKFGSPHFTKGGFSAKARESWLEEWAIKYPESENDIMIMSFYQNKKRFEKFDFIGAAWFADGRIFSANEELVEKITQLATHAAIGSHEGGGPWKSLAEYKAR